MEFCDKCGYGKPCKCLPETENGQVDTVVRRITLVALLQYHSDNLKHFSDGLKEQPDCNFYKTQYEMHKIFTDYLEQELINT